MKYLPYFFILAFAVILTISCTPSQKSITPEKFLQIENEILSTDLTPEAKESVLKKYNITLKDFEDYAQKVDSDPVLKAKIGEIRLKRMQGEQE